MSKRSFVIEASFAEPPAFLTLAPLTPANISFSIRRALGVEVNEMPIVPLVFDEPEEALARCAAALEQGVFAQAIRPPTVPPGTSRLRVVATAAHDPDDLLRAGTVLYENIMNQMGYSDGRREVVPTGGVRQHGR